MAELAVHELVVHTDSLLVRAERLNRQLEKALAIVVDIGGPVAPPIGETKADNNLCAVLDYHLSIAEQQADRVIERLEAIRRRMGDAAYATTGGC